MIVRCFNDPWLSDYLQACAQMPQDEREQLEAFTGEPYNVDGAAVGNFAAPGVKVVIKAAEAEEDFGMGYAKVLSVGGFVQQRPGVYRDFMINTPMAWNYGFQVTRICRRLMDAVLLAGAHRIETIVPTARLESRPELARWYKVLGYNEEGRHYGYCANGGDAISFSRVKH